MPESINCVQAMMSAKDRRLALTAELLRGLRSVKLMGWEEVMRAKVRGGDVEWGGPSYLSCTGKLQGTCA
jgi:hypothetical protein